MSMHSKHSLDSLKVLADTEGTKLPARRNRSSSESNLFEHDAEELCPVKEGQYIVVSQFEDFEGEVAEGGCVATLIPRSAIRVVVVVSSAAIAMLVPKVALLVSLAGASSGAALSLVCPSLIMLALPDYDYEPSVLPKPLKVVLCVISIALGVVGAVAGTWVALRDIWNEYA